MQRGIWRLGTFTIIYSIQARQKRSVSAKVLTWNEGAGFKHENIDEGETTLGKPRQTPIFFADGALPKNKINALFETESRNINDQVSHFILHKLNEY
jgi:hypothetical protein